METVFRVEVNIIGLVLSGVIMFLFFSQIKIKNREDKLFVLLTCITMLELMLDTIFWLINKQTFQLGVFLNLLVNTAYYFFQISQSFVMLLYIRTHMGDYSGKTKLIISSIPLVIGTLLVLINILTGCVFSIDAQNIYHRSWGVWGSIYSICVFSYIPISFYTIIREMLKRNVKACEAGLYFFVILLIPIVSGILQLFFYGLNLIWISMSLVQLLLFVRVEEKNYKEVIRELTDKKIQIMMSQIQPHFLYNTLCVIQDLAHGKAPEAEQATVEFSDFLRDNIDSLSTIDAIPFEKELKHTKNYLSLEMKRFENRLRVEYNIQTVLFKIPSLTLQPIVENAVRYGVCQREDGGTVKISTFEKNDSYIIRVEDDGIGFNPNEKKDDERAHIGIYNVERRLKKICNGSLEIKSEIGVGTTAQIKIPRESIL